MNLKYSVSNRIIETDLGDEMVLLHLDTQDMFTLNETGTRIWKAIKAQSAPFGPTDLVALVVDHYGVDPEDANRDVREYLNHLERAGLIAAQERAPDSAP
jgi:Coenzyme PQQ synthesis protein D (PqqD)